MVLTQRSHSTFRPSFSGTGDANSNLTVNYPVRSTATLNTDYTRIPATPAIKRPKFAAGSFAVRVTVDPTAETLIEPDETVRFTLASGMGYAIGTNATVVGTRGRFRWLRQQRVADHRR